MIQCWYSARVANLPEIVQMPQPRGVSAPLQYSDHSPESVKFSLFANNLSMFVVFRHSTGHCAAINTLVLGIFQTSGMTRCRPS